MEKDCCFTNEKNWFRYRTGAIIIENEHLLVVTNDSTEYYYTVGGGVHMGETAEACVCREVLEETGIPYEVDHLAVVCENFFKGEDGSVNGLDCQCIEFHFVMKSKGNMKLNSDSYTVDDEKEELKWVPLSQIKEYDIRPSFLKERMDEIVHSNSILHIVSEVDR